LYHDNVSSQVTHQPPQLAGVVSGSAGILFICVILYSRRKASSTTTPIFSKINLVKEAMELFTKESYRMAIRWQ
jgi:hypothetical protein